MCDSFLLSCACQWPELIIIFQCYQIQCMIAKLCELIAIFKITNKLPYAPRYSNCFEAQILRMLRPNVDAHTVFTSELKIANFYSKVIKLAAAVRVASSPSTVSMTSSEVGMRRGKKNIN